MSQVAPELASASTHPDFPNQSLVVNIIPTSKYFGCIGTVYGSGPSKSQTHTRHAVLYVRWPDGERYKYFPKSLAFAPPPEANYRVSSTNRGGKKVQIHKIPPVKRGAPTIFERYALQQSVIKPQR